MCDLMMVIFLSLHIVHLPEIQDLLALPGAVLLINLNSPGTFSAAFIGDYIVQSLRRNRGPHSPTSDIILEIKGETEKPYIVQDITVNFSD